MRGCFLCSRPAWRVLCVTGDENTRIAESSKAPATPLRSGAWGWSRPLPAPCAPGSRFPRHAFLHGAQQPEAAEPPSHALTRGAGRCDRPARTGSLGRACMIPKNQKRKLAPSLHARKVGQRHDSAASSSPPADQRHPKCKVFAPCRSSSDSSTLNSSPSPARSSLSPTMRGEERPLTNRKIERVHALVHASTV